MLPWIMSALLQNNILPELLNIIVQYAHIKEECGIYKLSVSPHDDCHAWDAYDDQHPIEYILPNERECYIKGIMDMIHSGVIAWSEEFETILKESINNDPLAVKIYELKRCSCVDREKICATIGKLLLDLSTPELNWWFDNFNEQQEIHGLQTYEMCFQNEYDKYKQK